MKSRTSFFNATVFKKNIARFAPLWGLYFVFLIIMFSGANASYQAFIAANIRDLIHAISIANLIYGGLCANVLFGDGHVLLMPMRSIPSHDFQDWAWKSKFYNHAKRSDAGDWPDW